MTRRGPYRQRTRPSHERWLVSYADFITLLFAFFVVLYASSQRDQKKVAKLASAIEQGFEQLGIGQSSPSPGMSVPPSTLDLKAPDYIHGEMQRKEIGHIPREMNEAEVRSLNHELQQALAPEIARHAVALRNSPDGLIISLQELGFFDSGSASLRADSQEAFARIASVLKERQCQVRIEGHTDPVPIHTAQFASNWELSTARATGLVKLLVQKYNYDPAALAAGGYAEFHPIASNDSPDGRRMNRRVDLVIVSAVVPPPASTP